MPPGGAGAGGDAGLGARVALVAIGNELLFGETVDTNSAWLGRTLTEWGLSVVAGFSVRDRSEEIQATVLRAMQTADAVIVSGGLGPTSDDLTKAAVADLLGVGLVVDEDVRQRVLERFEASGRTAVPRLAEGQAEILEGSTALRNDFGTAPGILAERDGVTVVLVPGVPSEMRGIVSGPLKEIWTERGWLGRRVAHRVMHTTGIPESRLAELVQERWDGLPPEEREGVGLAFLPDELGVDVRLTVSGETEPAAAERLLRLDALLDPALRAWRFEAESGDLAEAVSEELRRSGRTLAAAESCTGGLLSKRMTDRSGASQVFRGAVVAYDNEVKQDRLGVSAGDLERDGAVSETVARQMARGVATALGADVGVAITGVAGPTGGTPEKPVGTVWIAVATEGGVEARLGRFAGDRGAVRRRSAQAALALVLRCLKGEVG